MVRAAVVCMLLSGCWTNARGHVDVKASTAIWGGALLVGGAIVGAGTCQPTPDQCDSIERGDPIVTATMLVTGATLVGLAVLLDRAEK